MHPRGRLRNDLSYSEIFSLHLAHGPQLHPALPIQIKVQRTHHRPRQMFRCFRIFLARRASLVIPIVHDKRERKLLGKIFHRLRTVPESRPALFVDALQVIEKIAGGNAPRQPEARPFRNRAVRNHEKPAFIIPNGFISRKCRRRAYDHQSGGAAHRVKQQAHHEFLATSRNLYFSLGILQHPQKKQKSAVPPPSASERYPFLVGNNPASSSTTNEQSRNVSGSDPESRANRSATSCAGIISIKNCHSLAISGSCNTGSPASSGNRCPISITRAPNVRRSRANAKSCSRIFAPSIHNPNRTSLPTISCGPCRKLAAPIAVAGDLTPSSHISRAS